MENIKSLIIGLAVTVLVLTGYGLPSKAVAKPYYQGKTITVVIGLGPASGGTTVGRLLGKYMAMHIEGEPKVVIKNMPGAAFMKAHKYILKSAPKDGTVVYYGPRKPIGELLELPGHDFNYTEFTILGGIQVAGLVIAARSDVLDSGSAKSVADLLKSNKLKYGGLSPEHSRMLLSMTAMDLLGLKYRFVPGYGGSGKIRAALFRGEVNLATDAAHAYKNRVVPQLVNKNKGFGAFHIPILAKDGSLINNPLVPNVPSFFVAYKECKGGEPSGERWEVMKTLIKIDQTVQHVYMGPPGMNEEAAAAFRKAFMPALTSEAYSKEAVKVLTYAPQPYEWQYTEKVLASTKDVPTSTVSYLKAYIAKHSK
ncbi:MAG: hypothetical protein V3W17_08270 [Desulfobacteria bacterium]